MIGPLEGALAGTPGPADFRVPMTWLLSVAVGLVACGGGREAPSLPPPEPSRVADRGPLDVDAASFARDLALIARPRPPGSAHWRRVQDLCATRLEQLGYRVARVSYGSGVNVIGTRAGGEQPDDVVLVSAHYDSTRGCAGADDNATGVAATLELARMFAGTRARRTLTVACWDEEERGLVGSSAYAEALEDPGALDLVVVLEMIGYATREPGTQAVPPGLGDLFPDAVRQIEANQSRGDFLAVIHDQRARGAAEAFAANGAGRDLPVVRLEVPDRLKSAFAARDLQRSDHAPFWRRDVPAMMLTDTANFRNPRYHCAQGADSAESIDAAFAVKVVEAAAATVADALDR
jgi:Zn-dependent M28 family amino/carboxypeptidase